MQNPIFNLAKSLQNQGNPMMNNSMNQNQGMNMNSMNNMMNNQMNMNNQMDMNNMNNMMNSQMMNNQMNMNSQFNPMMMNPMMMNNNMGNMGTGMMNAAMNFNMNNQMMPNMGNNMGNMGNNQPQQQQPNNQNISVYFRAGANGENGSIMIQCSLSDRVSDLIERYKTKSMQDVSKKKFIFNAKALNKDLTVAEAGLNDGANIFVVNTEGVKGA